MDSQKKTQMTSPLTYPTFRASLVQMCSGRNVEKNVQDASNLIRKAADDGANYVLTPEVTTFMDLDREATLKTTQPQADNTALKAFQNLGKELKIWLHIGSMPILLEQNTKDTHSSTQPQPLFANRSFLIDPFGQIAAQYDKIHMFDVALDNDETYSESENYRPGDKAIVAKTPWGGLGMTICYDLRFPHLFRTLAKSGAKFIAVPAAFTTPTGLAHWHTLLRARAIETQCFIFAAAQGGQHEHGRTTFGHSLIISPWGEILAQGGSDPDIISADIDLENLAEVRSKLPSLSHDRPFKTNTAISENETPESLG